MSAIVIRFTCGHAMTYTEPMPTWPVCPCGETRIADVKAPPPVVRGTCESPLKKDEG